MNDALQDRMMERALDWLPDWVVDLVLGYFSLKVVGIIVIGLITWFFLDKRFRKRHGKDIPEGYKRTEEVTIDPTTGKTLRVFYNAGTGERFYREEN